MEKLIKNKKNIYIAGSILLVFTLLLYYFSLNNSSKNEKYFDLILASLYNSEDESNENRLLFLTGLDDPNISFFGDLSSNNIDNLEKYTKLDRDIILLKKSILEANRETLKSLSKDENFLFKDIAQIFFINLDLNNYQEVYEDNADGIENFFLKAVSRYHNENN
tara:strand:+ start:19 stop:510 length:492 start_codon:yes stop_codon:yes gene_type:complete